MVPDSVVVDLIQPLTAKQIDMTKVRTVIYYLPDGQSITLSVDAMEEYMDFSLGAICDTSDIDGVIHYFPKGNA